MTKSSTTNEINISSTSSKKFQESEEGIVVELGLKLEQETRVVGGGDKNCGPIYNGYNNIITNNNNYNNSNNNNNKNHILYSCSSSSTTSVVDNCPSIVSQSSITTPTTSTTNAATGGAGYVRGLHPFDVSSSYYSAVNPFFKSSGGIGTATMGYPFTATQWKELERQAMIYKYMMASLPVPPDLLYSSFPTHFSQPSTFAPASYYLGKYGSGISMRWSGNSKDAEPGRCRRTDGKKWRCSRDVAPNQKYCERHMHRGRPRSRKHVEQQLQQQQQQQQQHHSLSDLSFNTTTTNAKNNVNIASVPITKKTRLSDTTTSNPQCVASSVVQSCSKGSIFDHGLVSGGNSNLFEDSRNLAWNDEQQWSHLVQQANMNASVFQNQFEGEPLNLNSHAVFNPKSDELERPLIDAWSMGMAGNKNHGHGNNVTLSLNGGNPNAIDDEMCQIHMGIGLIDSWVSTTPTPGGPLAEVLMPGNPTMSDVGESEFVTPPATAVSSPSGVLQKNFATFSDSSGSNSPTTCNNSKASSEMPFHWLN